MTESSETAPPSKPVDPLLRHTERRLVSGIGFSVLMMGLSYACNFLLVPLMLSAWGPSGYSRWAALTSFVAYLGLFDLGGQIYIQNLLASCFARGEESNFRTILSRGMALYLWLGGAAALVWLGVLAIGCLRPVPVLGRPLTREELWVLAALGVNQFLVSIPFGVFATVYRASGHFTRATFIANFNKLLLFAMGAGVLGLKFGLSAMAFVYLAGGMVAASCLVIDSRRIVPNLLPLDIDWRSARAGLSLLSGSLLNWLISVANLCNQSLPVLILARFAAPEAVALFATHRTIAGIAAYVPGIVAGPLQPELSYLWSLAQREKFQRMLLRALTLLMLVTGATAIAVFAVAPLIFERWTSRQIVLDEHLLLLLLVQAVTGAGATVIGWALIASNRHRVYSFTSLSYAIVFGAGCLLVAPRWGLAGVVTLNLGLDVLYLGAILPVLASRELQVDGGQVVRRAVITLAVVAAIAAPLGWVMHAVPQTWNSVAVLTFLAGCALAAWRFRRRWWPREPATT